MSAEPSLQKSPDEPLSPRIGEFVDPVDFMVSRIRYLKSSDANYSVAKECRKLRRVSPALITLISQNKRPITLDRAMEITKLLKLSFSERLYFRDWIERTHGLKLEPREAGSNAPSSGGENARKNRREAGTHILKDWLHVFVKDSFQIKAIQEQPDLVYEVLSSIASAPRIKKSLQFLLAEGYLRKTLDGKVVMETSAVLAETPIPSQKVRQFHKACLQIAARSLELYGPHERWANTMVMTLSEESYTELSQIMFQFMDQLKDFADSRSQTGNRLYQVALHISPTGGRSK